MTLEACNPSSSHQPSAHIEAKAALQSKPKSTPRCRHFTADGTRCRLPILDTRSHLCFRHASLTAAASQPQHNDSEDLSADLLPEPSEYNSPVDVGNFLIRLLTLVTRGRISPRRASVLAYITSQLLHSQRSLLLENKALADQPEEIIFDLPRPNRDWPEPEPKPRPENPTYQDLRT